VWRDDAYRVEGTVAEVTARLREYVQAGAKGLIVQMPAPIDFETLEWLASDVRQRVAV
jgi:2-methylisocitrate lyase-like PEP mutase family enzyme